jgi:predicted nucleic acid-binding Zn ribbon protein
MEEPAACPHRHTRLIARDRDEEYRECLDCGEILEKETTAEPAPFDESLSDA